MVFWKKKDSDYPSQDKPAVEAPELKRSAPLSPSSPAKSEPAETQQVSRPGSGSLEERFGRLRSALGPGTVIQGKLSFDTPVRIDGKLSGEVFSSKALIVGENGSVDADIQVQSLIVMGKVTGQIKATERVELVSGGIIEADIFSPVITVEEGSQLNGTCLMTGGGDSSNKANHKESSNVPNPPAGLKTSVSSSPGEAPSGVQGKRSLQSDDKPDNKAAGAR